MTSAIESMVAATYVRDIGASRAFYELLGFHEDSSGKADTAAWSYLRHGRHFLLLASTQPALGVPPLPLLFYFFLDDLGAAVAGLGAAGVEAVHMGHPPHALGGEVKVTDPDGNTVLLGQRERPASQPPAAGDAPAHFSLLKEAAALVTAQGGTTASCQVTDPDGMPCELKAEVKLADSAGDTAWACLGHAEEILVAVPGAFIANQDSGITGFLASRRGQPG
jgi:catechol 2,3-dioxygenase-like lactoylglutathione lyase family enzyme